MKLRKIATILISINFSKNLFCLGKYKPYPTSSKIVGNQFQEEIKQFIPIYVANHYFHYLGPQASGNNFAWPQMPYESYVDDEQNKQNQKEKIISEQELKKITELLETLSLKTLKNLMNFNERQLFIQNIAEIKDESFLEIAQILCPVEIKDFKKKIQNKIDTFNFINAIKEKNVLKVNELISEEVINSIVKLKQIVHERDFSRSCLNYVPVKTSALHIAVEYGNKKMIKILIDNGANLDIQNSETLTPLMSAVRIANLYKKEMLKVIKLLIDSNASLSIKNKDGDTAFLYTIKMYNLYKYKEAFNNLNVKQLEIIKLLLNARSDINIINENNETGLMLSLLEKNIELVKILISYQAKVNIKNKDGSTVLHYLIQKNLDPKALEEYKTLAKKLIEQVDVTAKDINGKTAFDLAIENNYLDLAYVLNPKRVKKTDQKLQA